MSEVKNQLEIRQKIQIAGFSINMQTMANVFILLDRRKEVAKRFYDTGDENLIQIFEHYNQQLKDLLGI